MTGAEGGGAATGERVSVILAAHSEQRLGYLRLALDSLRRQTRRPDEVIVAVDHNDALLARVATEFGWVNAVAGDRPTGASGTRNAGAAEACGDVLVFLDDDVVAEVTWLERLLPALGRESVVGVGGRTVPLWEAGEPRWFPPEFLWVVGASHAGLPAGGGVVRNVWAENMALRSADFHRVGGFREGFGKSGNVSRPEDTDFCTRVSAATGGTWWYEPAAVIGHHAPAARSSVRFFLARCVAEGRGKAALAALQPDVDLGAERGHALRTIPRGLARQLRTPFADGAAGLRRAIMSVAGLGAVATGYALEGRTLRAAPGRVPPPRIRLRPR